MMVIHGTMMCVLISEPLKGKINFWQKKKKEKEK